MKTVKYTISFESLDTYMSRNIVISKKEYEQNLKFFKSQLKVTADYEAPLEEVVKIYEHEKTIDTTNFYTLGCSTTILSKIECKKGYKFK